MLGRPSERGCQEGKCTGARQSIGDPGGLGFGLGLGLDGGLSKALLADADKQEKVITRF